MKNRIIFLALLLFFCQAASADVDLYLDESDWRANVGAPLLLENFNSFLVDAPFDGGSPLALPNGVTLSAVDPGNKIDVSPFDTAESDVNGTPAIKVNNTDELIILFDEPISAWGADFREFQDDQERTVIVFYLDSVEVDSWVVADIPSPAERFIGFVGQGDTTFDEIRFADTLATDVFGIDDMEFSAPPLPAAPVPAASSWGLLLLAGLLMLFGMHLTRQRA